MAVAGGGGLLEKFLRYTQSKITAGARVGRLWRMRKKAKQFSPLSSAHVRPDRQGN